MVLSCTTSSNYFLESRESRRHCYSHCIKIPNLELLKDRIVDKVLDHGLWLGAFLDTDARHARWIPTPIASTAFQKRASVSFESEWYVIYNREQPELNSLEERKRKGCKKRRNWLCGWSKWDKMWRKRRSWEPTESKYRAHVESFSLNATENRTQESHTSFRDASYVWCYAVDVSRCFAVV